MLRRVLVLFVLSILFLGLGGAAFAQVQDLTRATDPFWRIGIGPPDDDDEGDDGDGDGDGNNGLGFGKKIAGAWFCEGCFVVGPDIETFVDCDSPGAIPAVQTNMYGADGTFSGVNPGNPNSYHGTWKKTGPYQVVETTILYGTSTSLADTTMPPDGIPDVTGPTTVSFICRIPSITDFDEDFQNSTARFSCKGYLPGGDPLDPDAEVFQSQGLNECRKVNASAEDLFDPPGAP